MIGQQIASAAPMPLERDLAAQVVAKGTALSAKLRDVNLPKKLQKLRTVTATITQQVQTAATITKQAQAAAAEGSGASTAAHGLGIVKFALVPEPAAGAGAGVGARAAAKAQHGTATSAFSFLHDVAAGAPNDVLSLLAREGTTGATGTLPLNNNWSECLQGAPLGAGASSLQRFSPFYKPPPGIGSFLVDAPMEAPSGPASGTCVQACGPRSCAVDAVPAFKDRGSKSIFAGSIADSVRVASAADTATDSHHVNLLHNVLLEVLRDFDAANQHVCEVLVSGASNVRSAFAKVLRPVLPSSFDSEAEGRLLEIKRHLKMVSAVLAAAVDVMRHAAKARAGAGTCTQVLTKLAECAQPPAGRAAPMRVARAHVVARARSAVKRLAKFPLSVTRRVSDVGVDTSTTSEESLPSGRLEAPCEGLQVHSEKALAAASSELQCPCVHDEAALKRAVEWIQTQTAESAMPCQRAKWVSVVSALSQSIAPSAEALMADGDIDIVPHKSIEYDAEGYIGKGSFGRVYSGWLHYVPVAIKLITATDETHSLAADHAAHTGNKVLSKLAEEVCVLKSLRHPHVLFFHGVCLEPPLLITELCPFGSLWDLIRFYRRDAHMLGNSNSGTGSDSSSASSSGSVALVYDDLHTPTLLRAACKVLSWPGRVKVALQAAKGMGYLHCDRVNVLHRDLKTPNLLLDEHCSCKVADFGLSKKITTAGRGGASKPSRYNHNALWAAPELLRGGEATKASDVYSFAIIMWELLMIDTAWSITEQQQVQVLAFQLACGELLSTLRGDALRSEDDDDTEGGPAPPPAPPLRPELPSNLAHVPIGGDRGLQPGAAQLPGVEEYVALMKHCWAEDTQRRPSFHQVVKCLRDISRDTQPETSRHVFDS